MGWVHLAEDRIPDRALVHVVMKVHTLLDNVFATGIIIINYGFPVLRKIFGNC